MPLIRRGQRRGVSPYAPTRKVMVASLLVFVGFAALALAACVSTPPASTTTQGEGFAIYLTAGDIPVSQMEALSHVEVADTPVISETDIVSYHWDTHEIELTAEAVKRLENLQVPTSGKTFVVCVDRQPVYWGAFWASYSSQSFDGITIMVSPLLPGPRTIRIGQGYPGNSFFKGEDPRNNPLIEEVLARDHKLASS